MSYTPRRSTARPIPSRQSFAPTQTPASTATGVAAGELPPYKKPSHPLTVAAQDQIKALNGREIIVLKENSRDAEQRITEAAGIINDKLREREDEMVKRRKMWERGLDTETRDDEEAALSMLQKKVDDMTKQLEENMRGIIDTGVAAKRIEESLQWLYQTAPQRLEVEYSTQMSQREPWRPRRTQGSDEDTDMGDERSQWEELTPGPTPLDGSRPALTGLGEIFDDHLRRKKEEYTRQPLTLRYSENAAYASFKGMVHEAKYHDDRPLPRKDTWFTETGSPAPGITHLGGDDEDDDIVMDRATISTRCPLTFQRFKEPLTSSKCPHTFEKNAVLEMIRVSPERIDELPGRHHSGKKAIKCPVTGCDQMLTKDDLHYDPVLVRKLQRMMRAEQEAAESDSEGVERFESRQGSTVVKSERLSSSRPQASVTR